MLYEKFKEINEKRRSIRRFLSDEIPDKDVRSIIEAARLAPSAGNSQPWRFIAIRNKKIIQNMAETVEKKIMDLYPLISNEKDVKRLDNYKFYYLLFKNAPLVLAVIGEKSKTLFTKLNEKYNLNANYKGNIDPDILSIGACVENMLLAISSLEYGATWMTGPIRFAQEELEKLLEIKRQKEHLVSLVAIGKPASLKNMPPKKSIDELISYIN